MVGGALAGPAAAAMTRVPRHLPPPARRRLRLRARRASSCPTWPTSASRTSTCRRRSRRGRGRCTATTWSTRRRSPRSWAARTEFRALVAAAHEAGLGVILDIVPNHMAVDDANRYWTEQREKFFDIDPETGRYRRFFDIDHLAGVRQEDPEVFEETHRLALSLVREGAVDGLRIDHPDGLADPEGYLRAAARRGRRARVGGEDPRPRRAAAGVVAGRGDGRLRVPQRRRGAVRGPGRRGAPHRALARARRRQPPVRASTPPRPSWSRRRRPSPPRSNGFARLLPRDDLPEAPRLAARLPHLHPRRPASAEDRRGAARGGHRVAARRAARVRHPLPADHAAGDGQGRRGHRLLPLPAAARAQRRRRRPGPVRASVEDFHAANAAAARRATCSSPRRTTPSARATCGRGSARWPAWPSSGRRTCAAGSS